MEPAVPVARPFPMRPLALSAAALLLPLALAACGSGDHATRDVATDPVPTTATGSPAPTATPTATPTAVPTVGTYPPFAPTDYTFRLSVQCFCAGGGSPIQVTVADAQVVGAIYTTDDTGRGGTSAGDAADRHYWLTINDVIAAANDTEAASVQVDWPAGQAYPTSVFVDQDKQMADEEVGYTVSDVQVG